MDETLLIQSEMAAAHATLIAKYEWFLNVKPIREFDEIRTAGLVPRSQGCHTNPAVHAALGSMVDVNEMIYLRPLGTTFDSTPRRDDRMFRMALHRDALPKILTVDWTCDGTWGLASIIKDSTPNLANAEIFCEVIRRRSSVAIYQAIPAAVLRVQTNGQSSDDPSNWPRLLGTQLSNAVQFY